MDGSYAAAAGRPEVVSVEPSCVWGDSSTVVKVALGMSSRRVKPSDIDLDHFAAEVAGIRDEVRVVG
ncbi:hypothetical protein GCM10010278_64430 [Streptomyces melanogenes]|nr:hypothetical protein GCM10010278_64430 [Streptomyces melanogenes]